MRWNSTRACSGPGTECQPLLTASSSMVMGQLGLWGHLVHSLVISGRACSYHWEQHFKASLCTGIQHMHIQDSGLNYGPTSCLESLDMCHLGPWGPNALPLVISDMKHGLTTWDQHSKSPLWAGIQSAHVQGPGLNSGLCQLLSVCLGALLPGQLRPLTAEWRHMLCLFDS